jgi:hypothetical protein
MSNNCKYPTITNYALMVDKDINDKLEKVNIFELINHIGIPFNNVSDEEILQCLTNKVILNDHYMYNPYCEYSHKNNKLFDIMKIATIVYAINNNSYNHAYPITVFKDYYDSNNTYTFDNDGQLDLYKS